MTDASLRVDLDADAQQVVRDQGLCGAFVGDNIVCIRDRADHLHLPCELHPGTITQDGTYYPRNEAGPPREEADGHGWADNAHGGLTCWYCGVSGWTAEGNCPNRSLYPPVDESGADDGGSV